MITHTLCFK